MSEDEPIPVEPAHPAAAPPEDGPGKALSPPPAPSRKLLGALVAVGFLATWAGGVWLWQQQQEIARPVPPPPSIDPARVANLEGRVGTLEQRLVQLEQRPAPAPAPDLRPLQARVDQLAAAVAALQGVDTGATQSLNTRLAAVEQHLAAVAQHEQAASAGTARLERLQVAGTALAAGQPLGEIPGAPPALAKFAFASPPTEAALRLSFPDAAAAAERASEPAGGEDSVVRRMWQRLQTLLIVRQGDKVLVGPPASQVLVAAKAKLDAGDLPGAVAALDRLDPGAVKAMAGWRAQAQSLLDARAALSAMARS